MKMNRAVSRDERGVTMVIVVLALFAIMGMLVLVVDAGGMLAHKRSMVAAADSAALSAAQDCAKGNGDGNARASALSYAQQNVSGVTSAVADPSGVESFNPSCDASSGSVRVGYLSMKEMFFAPVINGGDENPVTAYATATWGAAGSARPAPLMLQTGAGMSSLPDCDVPDVPPGTQCGFWYSSDTVGTSEWGWTNLDFDRWNVGSTEHCPNAGANQVRNWLQNGPAGDLGLNWTKATYVCVVDGHVDANWQELEKHIGKTMAFPVNDATGAYSATHGGEGVHGQVDKDGVKCPPPCAPHKYDIVGFAQFKLIALYDGDDPAVQGTPPILAESGKCKSQANFNNNNRVFALPAAGGSGCPGGKPINSATPGIASEDLPFVYDESKVQGETVITPYTECTSGPPFSNCDYTWDPGLFLITWQAGNQNQVKVAFEWEIDGVPGVFGACGNFGGKKQDKCLVVEYVRTLLGGNSGGGADFGLPGISLTE